MKLGLFTAACVVLLTPVWAHAQAVSTSVTPSRAVQASEAEVEKLEELLKAEKAAYEAAQRALSELQTETGRARGNERASADYAAALQRHAAYAKVRAEDTEARLGAARIKLAALESREFAEALRLSAQKDRDERRALREYRDSWKAKTEDGQDRAGWLEGFVDLIGQSVDDVAMLRAVNTVCRSEHPAVNTDQLSCALRLADHFAVEYARKARGRKLQSDAATTLATVSVTALAIGQGKTVENTKNILIGTALTPLVFEDVRQLGPRTRLYYAATSGLSNLSSRYREIGVRLKHLGAAQLPTNADADCSKMRQAKAALVEAAKTFEDRPTAYKVVLADVSALVVRCDLQGESVSQYQRLQTESSQRFERLSEDALADIGDVVARVQVLDADINATPFQGVRTALALPFTKLSDIIKGDADASGLERRTDGVNGRRYRVALRLSHETRNPIPAAINPLDGPTSGFAEGLAELKKPKTGGTTLPVLDTLDVDTVAARKALNEHAVRLNVLREQVEAIRRAGAEATLDLSPLKIAREQEKATAPEPTVSPAGSAPPAIASAPPTQPPAPAANP